MDNERNPTSYSSRSCDILLPLALLRGVGYNREGLRPSDGQGSSKQSPSPVSEIQGLLAVACWSVQGFKTSRDSSCHDRHGLSIHDHPTRARRGFSAHQTPEAVEIDRQGALLLFGAWRLGEQPCLTTHAGAMGLVGELQAAEISPGVLSPLGEGGPDPWPPLGGGCL